MKGPYTIPINQLEYDVKIKEISQGYNKDFPFMLKAQALVHSTRCYGYRFEFENNSWGLIRASSNKPSLVIVNKQNTIYKMLQTSKSCICV